MDRARYLEILAADSRLLAEVATRQMGARVPFCPGWAVRDVVEHVAEVYEHKIAAIERGGERPDPWPPKWPEDRDPVDWFTDARDRLLDTLAGADQASPSWTWWPTDQTAGFWVRRMAQETAVHRVDVQAATGSATPIDAELAIDGIDEVLLLMLAGDWSDLPQPELSGMADVVVDDRAWQIEMTSAEVAVGPTRGAPDATITGDPSALLLWLWGRAPDSAIDMTGSRGVVSRLRSRLALATQ